MSSLASAATASAGTLVVFLYAHDKGRQRDKGVFDNFVFFIRFGLVEAAGVTFSLLVSGTQTFSVALPNRPNVLVHNVAQLPGRGQMSHYKAFFEEPAAYKGCATSAPCSVPDVVVNWRKDYSRFLLLSDVVRGPFLPSYVERASWPALFLSPLDNADTKLVGATVSCEGCATHAPACTRMLHVESPVLGTDQIGLDLLLRRWRPWSTKWDEIYKNEVGGSIGIRSAGYNFAVHQRFWRHHDFRNATRTAAKCGALASRSVKLVPGADRKIKPMEGGEMTNLHAWYLGKGGSDCKGWCDRYAQP